MTTLILSCELLDNKACIYSIRTLTGQGQFNERVQLKTIGDTVNFLNTYGIKDFDQWVRLERQAIANAKSSGACIRVYLNDGQLYLTA